MPNLVTEEFNRMCTLAGVQCTITAKEVNGLWFRRYDMWNLGKNVATFSYKGEEHVMKPGQKLSLLADHDPIILGHPVWYEKVWS